MFFLKLAFLTCGFYLGTALILQALSFLFVRWRGEFILYGTRWGWALLFGLIWFFSFRLAWYFILASRGS